MIGAEHVVVGALADLLQVLANAVLGSGTTTTRRHHTAARSHNLTVPEMYNVH